MTKKDKKDKKDKNDDDGVDIDDPTSKSTQSAVDYWINYYSEQTGLPPTDKRVLDLVAKMYIDRTENEETFFVFLLFIIFGLGAYTAVYLFIKLLPYALV